MIAYVIHASLDTTPIDLDFSQSDKIMHIAAYFALMGWFVQIYQKNRTRIVLGIAFIVMGVSLEFLQDMGGVRYFDLSDMLANTTGVLLGWLTVFSPFSKILFSIEDIVRKRS